MWAILPSHNPASYSWSGLLNLIANKAQLKKSSLLSVPLLWVVVVDLIPGLVWRKRSGHPPLDTEAKGSHDTRGEMRCCCVKKTRKCRALGVSHDALSWSPEQKPSTKKPNPKQTQIRSALSLSSPGPALRNQRTRALSLSFLVTRRTGPPLDPLSPVTGVGLVLAH